MEEPRPVIDPQCPYCGVPFSPIPQRKKKCPACNNVVMVKYRPTDIQKKLVTEEQAQAIEREWQLHHFEQGTVAALGDLGVGLDLRRQLEGQLTAKLQRAPTREELLDGAERALFAQLHARKGWDELSTLLFKRALRLFRGEGAHWSPLVEATKAKLMAMLNQGCDKVEISTAGAGSCRACAKYEGKVFTIKQAFELMVLPVKGCKTDKTQHGGWCRCVYVPYVKY